MSKRDVPGLGATASEFTLLDDRGEERSLSSLGGELAHLIFYRGWW